MQRISIFILLVLASFAQAQVVEPKKDPPKKFKATAPTTVKANEHVLIDASSATGEIWFFYNETDFPKGRATTVGKVLILSTSVNGKYVVDVASLGDGAKEKVAFTVTGGVDPAPGPKPEPPLPADPIEQLKAAIAKIDARLSALEQTKPNPPDPKPKPPEPGDQLTMAIQGAYQQEFAQDKKDTATKMAICYRAAHAASGTATSWGDISKKIKSESDRLAISGKLPLVSRAINEQLLASGFPASPSVLMVAGDADKAKSTFSKIIYALETLP